jgi:cell division protein FtsZ
MARLLSTTDQNGAAIDEDNTTQAVIKVVGAGGGGGNALNRMIEVGLQGVEFITMNTDAQVLNISKALVKLQLGANVTRGLGAGGDPNIGRSAAEESRTELRKLLEGADLVFITAGLGGGTGTGAAPIIAEVAKELGALTVAVVTKPFRFEGPRRRRVADEGAELLRSRVDTMIVIHNDRLVSISERSTTLVDAFRFADDVLRSGVQSISDIIQVPGYINVDFADVRTIIQDAGTALMGIGKGTGEGRALQAAKEAVSSQLLESSIVGATRLLVNITSGKDITVFELNEAMDYIRSLTDDEEANIIQGHVFDDDLKDLVQVTVLATGFPQVAQTQPAQAAVEQRAEPELFTGTPASRDRGAGPVVSQEPPRTDSSTGVRSPNRAEDTDVPAFLRRKGS